MNPAPGKISCSPTEADGVVVLSAFDRQDRERDPLDKLVSRALIAGARLDPTAVFGPNPGASVSLPSYPWQQTQFRCPPTPEAAGLVETERRPFSGARTLCPRMTEGRTPRAPIATVAALWRAKIRGCAILVSAEQIGRHLRRREQRHHPAGSAAQLLMGAAVVDDLDRRAQVEDTGGLGGRDFPNGRRSSNLSLNSASLSDHPAIRWKCKSIAPKCVRNAAL
jgi:acyl transferase domain-containing protein